jgi:REP element-mobilizing transposase RayT
MPDHLHLFVGFKPVISTSDFIKEIKVESNEFINDKKWIRGKFSWQEGYGVFTFAHRVSGQLYTESGETSSKEIIP